MPLPPLRRRLRLRLCGAGSVDVVSVLESVPALVVGVASLTSITTATHAAPASSSATMYSITHPGNRNYPKPPGWHPRPTLLRDATGSKTACRPPPCQWFDSLRIDTDHAVKNALPRPALPTTPAHLPIALSSGAVVHLCVAVLPRCTKLAE